MFRSISYWWRVSQLKRRWRHFYSQATPVEGVGNLHLSVCDKSERQRVTQSCIRTWRQIPAEIGASLVERWERMQRSWDRRETGIPLRLPIFGVFDDTVSISSDHGKLLGWANVSGWRCGFTDSPDAVSHSFAGMFLPIWKNRLQYTNDGMDLEMARRFASYFLCTRDQGEFIRFIYLWHDETDELVKSWGFPIENGAAG